MCVNPYSCFSLKLLSTYWLYLGVLDSSVLKTLHPHEVPYLATLNLYESNNNKGVEMYRLQDEMICIHSFPGKLPVRKGNYEEKKLL